MATLLAVVMASAASLASAEIIVQRVWSRADANAPVSCQGNPAYNVVYGVNECVTVRGENGVMQRALQPFNSTHMAVVEYFPESNCDSLTTAFVLEMIQTDSRCTLQDFGMPDSGMPDEPMENTTSTAGPTVTDTTTPLDSTTTTAVESSADASPSSMPPVRRRQATSTASDSSLATVAITPTSTVTTSEAVTGTSMPKPPASDIPASYAATSTNGTLAKETERSLLISMFTTVGTVAKKDWCGDTNAPGLIKATYNVPLGLCFTIPAQTAEGKPQYGMAYAGLVGAANSVFVRWYDDASCNVAQTLYLDAVGLSQCMAIDDTRLGETPISNSAAGSSTASFAIKNAAPPVTSTSTKAATTTTTIVTPTPGNFQSAAATSAAASMGAITAGLISVVSILL